MINDSASVAELKSNYPSAIIISGTLSSEEVKSTEREVSRYATEDLMSKKFQFSLTVLNAKSGKNDLSFKKGFEFLCGLGSYFPKYRTQ